MQKARRQRTTSRSPPPPSTACRHTVSGSISLATLACFSPFPHGTGALSVTGECLALEGGPPSFAQDYTCPALLGIPLGVVRVVLPGCHRLWRAFPDPSTTHLVSYSPALRPNRSYNPAVHARRFGLFRVRSPLLAESLLFSLPGGTEMVHFPPLPSTAYVFS